MQSNAHIVSGLGLCSAALSPIEQSPSRVPKAVTAARAATVASNAVQVHAATSQLVDESAAYEFPVHCEAELSVNGKSKLCGSHSGSASIGDKVLLSPTNRSSGDIINGNRAAGYTSSGAIACVPDVGRRAIAAAPPSAPIRISGLYTSEVQSQSAGTTSLRPRSEEMQDTCKTRRMQQLSHGLFNQECKPFLRQVLEQPLPGQLVRIVVLVLSMS